MLRRARSCNSVGVIEQVSPDLSGINAFGFRHRKTIPFTPSPDNENTFAREPIEFDKVPVIYHATFFPFFIEPIHLFQGVLDAPADFREGELGVFGQVRQQGSKVDPFDIGDHWSPRGRISGVKSEDQDSWRAFAASPIRSRTKSQKRRSSTPVAVNRPEFKARRRPARNRRSASPSQNRKHGAAGLWTDDSIRAQTVLLLKLHNGAVGLGTENSVLGQSGEDWGQIIQQHLNGSDGRAALAMSHKKHFGFPSLVRPDFYV